MTEEESQKLEISSKYQRWVDSMISGDLDDKNNEQLAAHFDISVSTLYNWRKKADWDFIKTERRKLYASEILKADKAAIKAAHSGNVQAIELVYRRFDGYLPVDGRVVSDKADADLLAEAERLQKEHEQQSQTPSNLPGTSQTPTV